MAITSMSNVLTKSRTKQELVVFKSQLLFLERGSRLANITVNKAKLAIYSTALRTTDHDNTHVQLL